MPRRRKPYLHDPANVQDMITEAYRGGFNAGLEAAKEMVQTEFERSEYFEGFPKRKNRQTVGPRKKRRNTKSLLSEMAGKKWKTYKRKHPHGRKTYIQIRADVSRSRAYKKRKG